MTLFGVNLGGLAHQHLGTQRPECFLIVVEHGAYKAGLDSGRESSTTELSCRAYAEVFSSHKIDNKQVFEKDRCIRIYQDSLPPGTVPTQKHKIRMDDGVVYSILGEVRAEGSANAVWVVHGRGPG